MSSTFLSTMFGARRVSHEPQSDVLSRYFTKTGGEEKLAVIFDIGSGSVGGSIVGFSKGEKPVLLYTTRREIPFSPHLQLSRLIKRVTETTDLVFSDVFKECIAHARFKFFSDCRPDVVLYTLASPWHVSQVRIVRKKTEQPFYVGKEFIGALVHHELDEFRKIHRLGNDTVQSDATIIEGDIIDIRLNRYATHNPIGKQAQEFDMALFASSAPNAIMRPLKSIGDKYFPETKQLFSSFMFSFFNMVRDTRRQKTDYILIDITGEVTDLALVKNDRLLDIFSFPIGKNTIIRRVASLLNISFNEGESRLKMYQEGRLGHSEEKKLEDILTGAELKWSEFFVKGLHAMSPRITIPSDVFFTADESLGSWFRKVIASKYCAQNVHKEGPFSVVLFDGKMLLPHCHIGRGVVRDPFIAIESLFLKRKISMV